MVVKTIVTFILLRALVKPTEYETAIRELNRRINAHRYNNKPIYVDKIKLESYSARCVFINALETERDVLITELRGKIV